MIVRRLGPELAHRGGGDRVESESGFWSKAAMWANAVAATTDANDPLRKSGGPKCCDLHKAAVWCYPPLEEST